MKRFFLLLLTVHCSLFTVLSQAPQKFNYQTIVRDSNGDGLINQDVSFRISILQGGSTGTAVYSETHTGTTSSLGLVTLEIGAGIVVSGDFSILDWSTGSYYLKVEMDGTGGTSYQEMGTAQLLSVPYALFAETGTEGPQGPPGPAGTGLNNKGAWVSDSTYMEGDYVFDRSTGDPDVNSMWIFQGTAPYISVVQPYQDSDNWVEFHAPAGPPGDPATDDQILSISGHDLTISGGNTVALPDTGSWALSGDTLYYGGVVGIGTTSPEGKLEVVGDGTEADDEPLFEVKRNDGQTVFAVYPEGVRIYVDTADVKGTKGGFAVGGFGSLKGETNEFLRVTPDSVRIYVEDEGSKGTKGGFAVGGFSALKGYTSEYLRVTSDSVRVYVDSSSIKGTKGGFAVGGFSGLKGAGKEFLRVTPDSVRVYVDKETGKGTKGGFAVGGFSELKGEGDEYLRVTPDSVRVYIDKDQGKGTKGGFAVGGFSSLKNNSSDLLRVTIDSTRVFVGDSTAGFGIASIESGKEESFLDLTTENYFIGHETGQQLTTGQYNSILGYKSGFSLTEGESNCFMGYQSGFSNTTGYKNVFLGYQAGYSNSNGIYNQLIGYKAGYSNTSGGHNVFIGHQAGMNNTTAWTNTFIGGFAGLENKTGTQNVFMGAASGASNITGNNNVYIGYSSGNQNESGGGNVFIGYEAGRNEMGSNRLYIDNNETSAPLIYGDFTTDDLTINGNLRLTDNYFRITHAPGTGASPAYYCYQGALGSTLKSDAFAIRDALWVDGRAWFDSYLTTGSYININLSGSPSLYIAGDEALWYNGTYFSWGYGGTYNAFADKVTIGDVGNHGYMLYVNGTGYATGTWSTSDIKFKEDIKQIENPLNKIKLLEGVNYCWKIDEYKEKGFPEGRHYGVIAQDIEKVLPEVVMVGENGEKAVAYSEIIPVLIEAMKEQQKIIEIQNTEISNLKSDMKGLMEKVNGLLPKK